MLDVELFPSSPAVYIKSKYVQLLLNPYIV
jgi:hypothetical protein